ncbi:MAG TPA: hypothetical protein VKB79_15815 [Bryobacteraceae bacterium]|nr:hypothetical protein [Bryobacteraceae bacterium]
MSPNNLETNPGPTGPRTPEGKAISSQNALKHGLFTRRDFVLPDERDEYNETLRSLLNQLCPDGILEQTFADEIMSAQWRLRRCRIAESDLAARSLEDETLDEAAIDRKQHSIDRARASAHRILRQSIAELRKLQTERRIRMEFEHEEDMGLADTAQILRAQRLAADPEPEPAAAPQPAQEPAANPSRRMTMRDLEALMTMADKKLCGEILSDPNSFCTTNTNGRTEAARQGAESARRLREQGLATLKDTLKDAA